jgi:AAA15 family ATPase/GTPase
MLRSFRVANHRSLRDEQELLLMPQQLRERAALAVGAIYGANASGKSTVLDGLRFVQQAVRDSYQRWSPTGPIHREPFRLDERKQSESSWYVVEVVIDDVRWTYGFELDDNRILEEWLFTYPQQRRRVIFERDSNGIRFGTTVANRRDRARVLTDLIRENALLLSLAAQLGLGEVLPMFSWLDHSLHLVTSGQTPPSSVLADFLLANPGRQEEVRQLVAAADFGVTDLQVRAASDDRLSRALAELTKARERVDRSLDGSGDNVAAVIELGRAEAEADNARALASHSRVRLAHGEAGIFFEPSDESAGTNSWLALLPLILEALSSGHTLFVDEIDTSLHPRLVARVIELFRSPETNVGGGQLFFTTHDATLLGTSLGVETLKRDEIWFVEKAEDGATSLFPLSDFRPRKGENTERRYLGGSYGAVPAVFSESLVRGLVKAREQNHAAS